MSNRPMLVFRLPRVAEHGSTAAFVFCFFLLVHGQPVFGQGERAAERVEKLIRKLEADDADVRRSAARRLFGIGRDANAAVPALVEALKDKEIQNIAAGALGRIGEPAIPALAEALQKENAEVRYFAISALRRIGNPAVSALTKAIKDDDEDVRRSAAEALYALPAAVMAVPALTQASLQDENAGVRRSAALTLSRIGNAAVPALTEALQNEDADVREAAAFALFFFGPNATAAVPALIEALNDEHVDSLAASALGSIGPDAESAVPALIHALKNGDVDLRGSAGFALGQIGTDTKRALPALIEAMKDEVGDVRRWAARALGSVRSHAITTVPVLTNALEDEDAEVRESAAFALGRTGPEAAEAVPALVVALKDKNAEVRESAARSLGQIGSDAMTAVPALVQVMRDEAVRESAARALGQFGSDAMAAVPALAQTVKDENADPVVRESAARALGQIGPAAKAAVTVLIQAVQDEDADVRESAAKALGQIGSDAMRAVPALIQLMGDKDIRSSADSAISAISADLQDAMTTMSHAELDKAVLVLAPFESDTDVPQIRRLTRALHTELRSRRWFQIQRSAKSSIQYGREHPWLLVPLGVVVYVVFLLFVWSATFLVRPLWILRCYEALTVHVDIKAKSKKLELSFRAPFQYALLLRVFAYRKRVLNAWVKHYVTDARKNFAATPTVEARRVHVPLPVVLNDEVVQVLSGQALQPGFSKPRSCLVIWGEGGIGKTSWACQLGRWSMEPQRSHRLTRQLMLPVLIEGEVQPQGGGKDDFTEAVRGKLQALVGEPNPVSRTLVTQLLRKKFILVIVDRFSEMKNRDWLDPDSPDFAVAALVVTSRVEERLGDVPKDSLCPVRLEVDRLSGFVHAYLSQMGKRGLFVDKEFLDACTRLSQLVGQRQVTPLLAKLYLGQLIAAKESESTDRLPSNIPDLMLRYVDELHPGAVPDTKRQTQTDAKEVAWLCVKNAFLPGIAPHSAVLKELGSEDAQDRLNYLESTLHLIKTEGRHHDQVRFLLDPLAEYLAGLKVVEMYRGNSKHWERFLGRTDEKNLETIQDFLAALRECCLASDANVPELVVEELARRGGIDPKKFDEIRRHERVKMLKADLRRSHPDDRKTAAKTLEGIGPAAKSSMSELAELLKDPDVTVRQQAADAIFVIGPTADHLSDLVQALQDEDVRVRERIAACFAKIEGSTEFVVRELVGALKDVDPRTRAGAGMALHGVGPPAHHATEELCNLMADERADVRASAAMALGAIRVAQKRVVETLTTALRDDDPDVRRVSAYGLGKLGAGASDAVVALIARLEDPERYVRERAAEALGNIGPPAKAAVSTLADMITKDPDTLGAFFAISALGKIGPEAKEAVHVLRQMVDDDDRANGDVANWALCRIAPTTAQQTPHKS